MKRIINGLLAVSCLLLAVSCADYNVTDNFSADPDPSYVEPYKDLGPIKSYIDREKYPNMALGAMLKVADFNKQELAHAAAVTNFDDYAFGNTLMSGNIVSAKGVMNFLDMKDLLDHVEEIGGEVFGSPIAANATQPDEWLSLLTAPIEIPVDFVEEKTVDFTTMTTFDGTVEGGSGVIENFDGVNTLKVGLVSKVRIIEDFHVDPLATYTVTFWARATKDASYNVTFSGKAVDGGGASGRWSFAANKWVKVTVESKCAEDATEGYLRIENTRSAPIYIKNVSVVNAGRITSFDLIDEPLDTKSELESGVYDLKHSTDKIFWQDIFGSENYAPTISKVAKAAYEKHGGDPAALKFFISETGLENEKTFESLKYWMNIWDKNGAKIDGINAKLNLTYSEDATQQAANVATLNKLLDNLAKTGKLIRLSNFDIKYQDAEGNAVLAEKITDAQRQKLADYYGEVIKSFMNKIPHEKQAGLCKGNMLDTSDPVGLWANKRVDAKGTRDWVRTATYKAFCDALSGK